jgi:thiosulfate reductase / polysulfide reductase chain A
MTDQHKEQVFRSVCRSCHGGCAALLTVKDGRLTKVRPAPDSPFNCGQMCVKGLATPELVYHPSRLRAPLKRDGERGSNRWKEISWDTALDEIAARLDAIRKESGPESVAIGQGTGRHHYLHVLRFANSFGTPNWYEPGLAQCFIPRITVSNLTYGGFVSADYYSEVNPKTILFWGHNPIVSGADGELSFPVRRALEKGAFGIAVDPRRSETAKLCKMWLPIRPGTDAAMALAMVNVIISEGIYDRNFVEKWTVGFDELKTHTAGFTPQWAEAITGVPARQIADAARRYATEKPSILEWGVAIEQNPNCLQNVRAISLLRGLTGNIDVPGGDILGMNIVNPYPTLRDQLPKGMLEKRLGAKEFKLLGGFRAFMPSAHIPALFKAMRTCDPYRIRALLLFGNNPLVTVANAREVRESMLKTDLLVATDLFMTPSAALADYVLPAAYWPEVNQMVELPYVSENAVFAQQKVVQVGQCRQDEEIMIDLARRLKLPCADESFEDILDHRLEPLGMKFEDLKQKFMVFPKHEYRKFEKTGFRTPSRKVELYCKALERLGYDPLPTFKEPPESPVTQPELAKKFPYVLTTGSRRLEFFLSEHRQIESLRKRRPNPTAEIHPATASRHGISDGDWMLVSSPRGRIRMKAVVTEDIREDTINVDHGWWFPEKGGPEFGVWESNANVLTSNAPPYDPAFGSYQLRGLLCSVEKAGSDQ